jgi:TANFOR domain-containing protein
MIVTLYKKTVSRILLFACLLTGNLVIGQQYPVQIVPQLLPPYTLHVSDYYNGANEKLVVLLTNTDLNKPVLQVRLRLSIQGQAARLISRDNMYYPAIQLDAGIANRISLSDLAPYFNADNLIFQGITRAQYVQSGKLPEGFYQFCFEAIEIGSNQVVGRSSCAMAWISLNDPPMLNLPVKAESIVYKDPQNIIFQWTPRNYNSPASAFSTEYEFSLVELWDNGLLPEAAFGTAQPLYRTTTKSTTLLYGPADPLLLTGRRYAWRIRAQVPDGADGGDAWRNNGYSEIYWFTCQNNCAAPLNVQHEISSGRATITWAPNPNQTNFIVDYREKGQVATTWYSNTTTANRMMLYDLKKDKIYEYRVGGTCDNGITYSYSDIKILTMGGGSTANADCGVLTAEPTIANRTPIQTLLTGDEITAGDFPVKLLQVSGRGSFTGAGYVTVPFLGQNRVKVKFTGISVNTDKQLIGGLIETTYDTTEKQIGNLDQVIEGGGDVGIVRSGVDTAGYYVDMEIPGPGSIKVELDDAANNGGGGVTLTITGSDGTVKEIKVNEVPATIKDKNGTIYGIDKDGNVTPIGESGTLNMTAAALNTLQPGKAVVRFAAHDKQQYAFDAYQPIYGKSILFKEKYEKLAGDYYVSAKAIAEATTDVVKAVIDIKDKTIIADSIRFITAKGTRYESKLLTGNTWEIHIVGGPGGDGQELYALFPQANGKYLSLGKLLIASYKPQNRKLVLVPVNGAAADKAAISQQMNAMYNPVAVSFEVTQDSSFNDKSWDLNHDDKLAVSGSGWLSNLTGEMKALNNAYAKARTIQNDAIYLFVLNSSDSSIAGDMPRGKQFGYLFNGANGKVAAHETGHGLFQLKHVFDGYGFKQGELPSNIMDYPAGEGFTKYQWDAMHDPGIVIPIFEKEADGELKVSNVTAFKDLKNVKTNTYTFLSPGGFPITIPDTATDISISETNYFNSTQNKDSVQSIPFGTLVGFSLTTNDKTERYIAFGKSGPRTFTAYYCNDGGKAYIDTLSAKETTRNIIIAYPCLTASSQYNDDTRTILYTVKAKWAQVPEEIWKKTQGNNYTASGYFSNAELLLNKIAIESAASTGGTPAYDISAAGQSYSDFEGSKEATDFLLDNTECEVMPLPVIMNIANLIKLYPAEYGAFVSCVRDGKELKLPYYDGIGKDTKYEQLNTEGITYLAAFEKYVEAAKQQKGKLASITDSDEMETLLGNMCRPMYSQLTAEERIQIIKVLTRKENWITGCIVSNRMQCEEAQLITVINSIPDNKQAVVVAEYLNNDLHALLRLVRDVDRQAVSVTDYLTSLQHPTLRVGKDVGGGGNNHEQMMKAIFYLCQEKDERSAFTREDLLGNRLFYNAKIDYGLFTININVNQIDFDKVGGASDEYRFTIHEYKNQEFKPGVNSEVQQRLRANIQDNGFKWINYIKPLDAVTVVFDEDCILTNGKKLFDKGDIVRMPALYLWYILDTDAQQTAQLLRANAIKFVANTITYFGMGVEASAAEFISTALDLLHEAYTTNISPSIDREKLKNPGIKRMVEDFDNLSKAYELYKKGQEWYEMGKEIHDWAKDWLPVIRGLKKANLEELEKEVLSKLYDLATKFEEDPVDIVVEDWKQGWKDWEDYAKEELNGEEFAKIGDRHYSREAVDVCANNRFGVLPSDIEEAIVKGAPLKVEGTVTQKIYDNDQVWVVTETVGASSIVRAVSMADWNAMDVPGAMNHIKFRDRKDPDRRDISGCHDAVEFDKISKVYASGIPPDYQFPTGKTRKQVAEIVIFKDKPHPDVPDVRIIEYKVPSLTVKRVTDGGLKGETKIDPWIKTIYNPSKWTDARLAKSIKEAFHDANIRGKGMLHTKVKFMGTTKEGYKIEFWFRNNKVESFYFAP